MQPQKWFGTGRGLAPRGYPAGSPPQHPPSRNTRLVIFRTAAVRACCDLRSTMGQVARDGVIAYDLIQELNFIHESDPTEGALMQIVGLDHIQLAMPEGGEEQARRFYGALLGLAEIAKPTPLAARGGC